MRNSILLTCGLLVTLSLAAQNSPTPAAHTPPMVPQFVLEHNVQATLPNGRDLRPVGDWVSISPFPFALSLRPDGNQLAIPSIGWPFSLNLIDLPTADNHQQLTARRFPVGGENDPAVQVHAGSAYSLDGQLLYTSSGDSGKLRIYSTTDWSITRELSLNTTIGGHEFKDSFAATLALSPDGHTIYVLDQANFRVVAIDTATLKILSSIPTGNYPFSLTLSPDGARLFITNTGLFEYNLVGGLNKNDLRNAGLKFPPTAYPSKEAREGATVEGHKVPALGSENSVNGSSLWSYNVSNPSQPVLLAKLHLGDKITEKAGATVGGSAPTGVVATQDHVYVTLAHQDSLLEFSADGSKLQRELPLTPFSGPKFKDAQGHPLRGIVPSGIAAANGKLYIAESGINAVAVVSVATFSLLSHIPVGWNPSALTLSPDGATLYVVNAKGRGTGPNGGANFNPAQDHYIGDRMYGSVSIIKLADLPHAAALTQSVISANTAAIDRADQLPHLKHCFYIIRENRTYDEVLGDIPGTNGDPSLARFGINGWAEEDKNLTHLQVTPNLHALAARFAIGDNFYVDSDVSADGHRWAVGIIPTPFFMTAWTSGYGGRRDGSVLSTAPGRRAFFGGADAPMPEDEPQFGTLWEHIVANGKRVLNYGEGLEIEGNDEMDDAAPEGQRLFLNAPLLKPIFESTDRHYPTFNMGIPDQYRFAEFERDMTKRIAKGTVPELIVIRLPNDHTSGPRPDDGYPSRTSFVADNDLALGRIIDFLSKTPLWKDSAVFVTEDDAQGGIDHVDAHRSILLVASPWTKPGAVARQHTSFGSITRTIDELLGLGPLNLQDALAGEINGVFDLSPHLSPFNHLPSDTRIFDPAKAKLAHPKNKAEAAALRDMDDADEIKKELKKSKSSLRRKDSDD